jgi:hypothetical protein
LYGLIQNAQTSSNQGAWHRGRGQRRRWGANRECYYYQQIFHSTHRVEIHIRLPAKNVYGFPYLKSMLLCCFVVRTGWTCSSRRASDGQRKKLALVSIQEVRVTISGVFRSPSGRLRCLMQYLGADGSGCGDRMRQAAARGQQWCISARPSKKIRRHMPVCPSMSSCDRRRQGRLEYAVRRNLQSTQKDHTAAEKRVMASVTPTVDNRPTGRHNTRPQTPKAALAAPLRRYTGIKSSSFWLTTTRSILAAPTLSFLSGIKLDNNRQRVTCT